MRRKKTRLVTIAGMAAILLALPAAIGTGSTPGSTSQRELLPPLAGEATDAVSTAANIAAEGEWPMAGADSRRTSWTSEEVRGRLDPIWYRPIEPYIPQRVQIVAANDLLYISTARGLYALDAATGAVAWTYPTGLPLGHSPTVVDGVAYVGGLDKRLHAVDAVTGQGLWTFDEAKAGFQTNPLVANGVVYIGNRDGYMYAVGAHGAPNQGQLIWRHETHGAVLFSAAYKDNTIYFASNDAHAYALDATDGALVWKSAKLPGSGFHSWWPVVYTDPHTQKDYVIFAGSNNYRMSLEPGPQAHLRELERVDLYYHLADGELIGPRLDDGTVDASRVLEYYEEPSAEQKNTDPAGFERHGHKPWRRTYFVLEAETGQELATDFDGDGLAERAPVTWFGNEGAGNRQPPMVGPDGLLYQSMHYVADEYIPWGNIVGWKPGESSFSTPMSQRNAMDEPMGYSGGGSLIYWSRCGDRVLAAVDITSGQQWTYYSYDLSFRIPGYDILYDSFKNRGVYKGTQGSVNGICCNHGDQNPPIPYRGKVYIHRSNSVIAFGESDEPPVRLPMAPIVKAQAADPPSVSVEELRQDLSTEIQKILDAGHLRPGYLSHGSFNLTARNHDDLTDYWHYPSDILYALTLALSHLPMDQQEQVKAYLEDEYAAYPPHAYTHIGWRDGAAREAFHLPPEVDQDRASLPPTARWQGYYDGWTFPPQMFYALWKYAEISGNARAIFDSSSYRLGSVPANAYLAENPQVHNAYISGYLGYLKLENLAGYSESSDVRSELNRLLALRATAFDKDVPWTDGDYRRTLTIARNFMYIVPELGQYLHDNALKQVQQAVDGYEYVFPHWFAARAEDSFNEAVINPLHDYQAMFQAKALILKESHEELLRYLDVPAFEKGDLFYIQNLVAAIEARHRLEKTAAPSFAYHGSPITYTLSFSGRGITHTLVLTDSLPLGLGTPGEFELEGTGVEPAYDDSQHRLIWSDAPAVGEVTIRYVAPITTDEPQALVNTAELSEPGGVPVVAARTVIANPKLMYFPLILKNALGDG